MSPRVEADESYTKCLYPDDLLEGFCLRDVGRLWWVLCTKSRQENVVARELLGYQIPFYLPMVRKTSIRRARKVISHVPLFPGCVFVFASDEERVRALTTNRISRVLTVYDPERLEHDLRQIARLIATQMPLTVEARLPSGEGVRVRHGPLEGLEGVVVRREGQTRLVVAVDSLQRAASIEIDDSMLDPLVSTAAPRVSVSNLVPQRRSQQDCVLDDLPTPPELRHATEAYCKREGIRRKRHRLWVEQQLKLRFYYGGQNVICVDTPEGRRIIAHGIPGSGELRSALERLSPQQRAKAVIIPVESWVDNTISTSSTFLHDA
ncbi:MAG TPA: transcription termination/antitermination NusG family protein [Thermoguttaceae bacterium]|nr:transcription termination/antitermination NusG family protein [Thermoguttaceae bacterium]